MFSCPFLTLYMRSKINFTNYQTLSVVIIFKHNKFEQEPSFVWLYIGKTKSEQLPFSPATPFDLL